MARKCIDQMPPPIAVAAVRSHIRRATPFAARTRPPRSSAVYDANIAMSTDIATSTRS
jgi:hypothetical protein